MLIIYVNSIDVTSDYVCRYVDVPYIRAVFDLLLDPLPVFLGMSDRLRPSGDEVYVIIGLATQDDRVNHDDLQCEVRVRNRELLFVKVVGVIPAGTSEYVSKQITTNHATRCLAFNNNRLCC